MENILLMNSAKPSFDENLLDFSRKWSNIPEENSSNAEVNINGISNDSYTDMLKNESFSPKMAARMKGESDKSEGDDDESDEESDEESDDDSDTESDEETSSEVDSDEDDESSDYEETTNSDSYSSSSLDSENSSVNDTDESDSEEEVDSEYSDEEESDSEDTSSELDSDDDDEDDEDDSEFDVDDEDDVVGKPKASGRQDGQVFSKRTGGFGDFASAKGSVDKTFNRGICSNSLKVGDLEGLSDSQKLLTLETDSMFESSSAFKNPSQFLLYSITRENPILSVVSAPSSQPISGLLQHKMR